MRSNGNRAGLLFAAMYILLAAPGQTFAQSQVAKIDALVAQINRFIKQNLKSSRVFGEVSGVDDKESRWSEFPSEDEMEKARTGDNLSKTAKVWTRAGKVAGTSFTFTSPSGDWAHLITYYFRDDGSLAKIQAQLNTFYGNLSIVRQLYFDKHGVLLKNTRQYLDLKTKRVKKPGEFFDHSVPVYHNVSALPFQKLL